MSHDNASRGITTLFISAFGFGMAKTMLIWSGRLAQVYYHTQLWPLLTSAKGPVVLLPPHKSLYQLSGMDYKPLPSASSLVRHLFLCVVRENLHISFIH